MRFWYLALIFLPLAFGRPHLGVPPGLRHHGGSKHTRGPPPPDDTIAARAFGRAHHGGTPPGHHRRIQKTNTTTAAPQETITPRFQCGENPLPRQETGCPCFNLETITGQMDLGAAEYCDYSAWEPTLPEDDPCSRYVSEYVSFSASSPWDAEEGSNIYFGTSNDPGYGRYCYASVDYFTGGEMVETGESHSYYQNVEVTEEEYGDCKNTLNTLKGQLPATCSIGTYEEYLQVHHGNQAHARSL